MMTNHQHNAFDQNTPRAPLALPARSRSAFTLVELLVSIGILIVLTVMTLTLINVNEDEDRVRAGAAQVRSFLEGARDRAIHAGEPRGVRFLLDTPNLPSDPPTVSSMLYIGSPESYRVGAVIVGDPGPPPERRRIVAGNGADWNNLLRRGLIPTKGAVIWLTQNDLFFTMDVLTDAMGNIIPDPMTGGPQFFLTKDYQGSLGTEEEYALLLNPTVLPNQEPRNLPRDVVIDINNSQVPTAWSAGGSFDVLFSPHGTVTGLVASAGVINLVVAEGVDVFQGFGPGNPNKEGNERVVSLRTQTGGISVHNVDPADPFGLAARGEVAQ